MPDDYYTTRTVTIVNSGNGNPQPSQPRVTHTLLDTSNLNNLIISVTALDDGIESVQVRTFYKNANGMAGADIIDLPREGDSLVFSADITDQVNSMMRDSDIYEMTYFFAMSGEEGGFLQYPEVIDMNSLEGAFTVRFTDPPDLSTAAIVEHTPPVVTNFDNIPATFTITQLQAGEVPTINVYYRSELTSNGLSIVKGMGQLTHVDGDTYTVNLADPEFKQMGAYTIEYYISTNRGNQWFYYPQGMNPYALTGLYSTSIPQELYGPNKEDLRSKIDEAFDLWIRSSEGENVGLYPKAARDAIYNAVLQGEDVIAYSEDQAEINNATQMLTVAIESFIASVVTPLQDRINNAQWLRDNYIVGTDVGQYPAEARDALEAAIAAAIEWKNPASTEAELEAAYQALDTAITTFLNSEIRIGDPRVIFDKVNEIYNFQAGITEGDGPGRYPSAAYTDLNNAIVAAMDVTRRLSSQAQINDAFEDLENAFQIFKGLQSPEANKGALRTALEAAQALLDASVEGTEAGQYQPGSKLFFQNSIYNAMNTLTNLLSTQEEVDRAIIDLNDASVYFELHKIPPVDKALLQAAINEAEALLEDSTAGEEIGQFPAAALEALETAIITAKAVMDQPATEEEVAAAQQALEIEIAVFRDAVIKVGDKSALQGEIDEAAYIFILSEEGNEVGQYPAEAKAALGEAIDAAVAVNGNPAVLQAEIDAATQTLAEAVTAFHNAQVKAGDDLKLREKIAEALSLYNDSPRGPGAGGYPDTAFNNLNEAIMLATDVTLYPASETKLDNALQALTTAIEEFAASVIEAGDTTDLQDKINQAKDLVQHSVEGDHVGEYPSDAFAVLKQAIEDAEVMIGSPGTQEQIDEAYQAIAAAIGEFENEINQEGNYPPLLLALAEATALYDSSTEGYGAGQYWPEARAIFQTAINAAQTVAGGPSTQEEIAEAIQAIAAASEDFRNAVVPSGDITELQAAITELTTLLSNVTEGDDAGEYPVGSKALLQAAITAAASVINQPATQEEIDQAYEELEAASDIFKAAIILEGNNLTAVEKLIEIGILLEDSTAGSEVGEYPAEAIAALKAVFDEAAIVLNKPSSQVRIDAAYQALVDAQDVFGKTQIQAGDSEDADAVVTEAETLLRDSVVGEGVGEYPTEAAETLKTAIEAAKAVLEHPATQAQIDAAKVALEAAITAFEAAVIGEGDGEEADAVVASAETLLRDSVVGEGVGEYPTEAAETLKTAIEAAKAVLEHPATQAQIDAAKVALEAAVTAFEAAVIGEGDGEEAGAVVASAETLLRDSVVGEGVGEYPSEAAETLKTAIEAAKAVLEHPATQAQIDAAKATLEAAVAAFEAAVIGEGDGEEAGAVVTEAETLLRDSVIGEGVGEYPTEAAETLKTAIKAAKAVLEHPATQAQIDAARATLEAAITAFEAAVIGEGDGEEAGAVVASAETLLRDSVVGEGVGEYPAEAAETLKTAIEAAKAVLEHPATQAQIEAAKATLEAAVTAFEAAVIGEGDGEEAGAVVASAETLLRDSVVGEGVGEYPSEAAETLKTAIEAAKEVLEHPATQAQIDAAAVNKEGGSEEANAAVKEAEALLIDVPVGEDVGQYPAEAVEVLKAAIETAKEVLEHSKRN
ncbi:hypothetical protein [Paenibacillus sp. MMS20-IR301]|uniref:hypothetical protein n=1 Tax=Paenibacillus sp. MMS20-IR301 TaxID=2895946 RepID=UPI0028EDA0EC|nr:hypothetical protein [Paenibacillus sp. MMS20-IR301]WNS41501.1 hypothetical protein LOS79_21070 [Paenibacillus sp. MMS20-IR301]